MPPKQLSERTISRLQQNIQDPNKREQTVNVINTLRQKGVDPSQLTNLFPTGEQIQGTQGPSTLGREMVNRMAQGINRGAAGTLDVLSTLGGQAVTGFQQDPQTTAINEAALTFGQTDLGANFIKDQLRASIDAFPINEGAENISFEMGTLLRGAEIFGESLPLITLFQSGGAGLLIRANQGGARGFQMFPSRTQFLGRSIPNPFGARQLDPKTIQSMGRFQRMLVDAARDPAKFNSIEAAISLAAAGAGQTVDSEEGRALRELVGAFGAPFLYRILSKIGNVARNRFFMTEGQAENIVGMELAMLMDTPFLRQMDEAQRLEREIPGLQTTLGQATRNRKIVAAERALDIDASDLDLENRRALFKYMRRVKQAMNIHETGATERVGIFQREAPSALDFQARLDEVVLEETTDIQNKLSDSLNTLNTQIFGEIDDLKRMDIGERAFSKLQTLKTRANKNINHIYQQIEDLKIPPRFMQPLRKAMIRASSKGKIGTDISTEVATILDRLSKNVSFSEFETVNVPNVASATRIDPARLTPVKPRRIRRTGQAGNNLRELLNVKRDINDQWAKAQRAEDRPTLRRLAILRAGIDRVFDDIGQADFAKGQNLALLKTANKMRREFAKLFDDHEMKTIFAMTGQGQLKVDPTDVMNYFVHPTKAVKRRAQAFRQATGNTPEALAIVQDELLRRLKANAFDNTKSELIPGKVQKFKAKYADVIESYGLQDKWKNVDRVTEEFESSVKALTFTERQLAKSAIADFANTEDVTKFIDSLLDNPTKLKRFQASIRERGNFALKEGFRQTIVEHMINKAIAKRPGEVAPEIPEFSDALLGEIIQNNGDTLQTLLGREHFNDLKTFFSGISVTRHLQQIPKAEAMDIAMNKRLPALTAIVSMIRSAFLGILSPGFVGGNLAVLALESHRSGMLRRTLMRALTDKEMARQLAMASKDQAFAPYIKTFFTPFFGQLAADRAVDLSEAGQLSPEQLAEVEANTILQQREQELAEDPDSVQDVKGLRQRMGLE